MAARRSTAITRPETTVADLRRRQVERIEWRAGYAPELTSMFDRQIGDGRATYAIMILGTVGNRATVAHLRDLTEDPEVGAAAVTAIRSINERVTHNC